MDLKFQQALERVLVQTVQARRCLQLYPRSNHLVSEARASLHGSVRLAVAAMAKEEATGKWCCEVRRDGFFVGEQELAAERISVGRFARLLYLNGAKLFCVSPQATGAHADAFIEASLLLENNEGQPDWTALECEHFGVERLAEAAVTSGEAQADVDLVAYLTARSGGEELGGGGTGSGKGGGGSGTGDGGVNSDLRDLIQFFQSVQEGHEEERQALLNTLMDSTRMAEAFSYVANAAMVPGQKELSGEALRQVLKHIRNTIETLPEESRDFIVNNVSQAVLGTDPETRERLVSDVLSEGIGEDSLRDEITKRLPPRLGASVLMHHVNLHDGTASMVNSFVEGLPNEVHRKQIKKLLNLDEQEDLNDPGAATPQERMRLTQKTGAAPEDAHTESPEEVMARSAKLQQLGMRVMRVGREELAELQRNVREQTEVSDNEHDAFTLFLLFATGQMEVKDARLLENLQTTLHNALEMERFDLLNRVIEFALGNLRDDLRPDTFRVLSHYLTPLYQQKQFENYIRTLSEKKRLGGDGTESLLLESVARGAAPVLLAELETEQVKRRRFVLLSLLVAMGPIIAPRLRQNLANPNWYVVRNAVYLLGKLKDLQSLEALSACLRHEDARVRLETVDALEELGVPEVDDLLKHAIKDSDPKVRGHAAAALARRGDSSHFDAFVRELRRQPLRMLRRPDYTLGVIGALGTLGDDDAVQVLRGFSRWCWLPVSRRKEMRSACERALQDIARRGSAESLAQAKTAEAR